MDYINKKRKSEFQIPEKSESFPKDNRTEIKYKSNIIKNKEDNDSMNALVDTCFNNFINGDTNNLIENYNLLKQKFFDSI